MQGVVQKISSKDFNGKILSSFAIKGEQGWFSLGTKVPTFKEGDSIQFEFDTNGNYRNARDITPWKNEGVANTSIQANKSKPAFGGWKGGGGKSDEEKDYWKKKDAESVVTQKRIEIQAARNAAIESAKLLIEKELFKLPTKVADKYDAYMELVNELVDEYLKNTDSRLSPNKDASIDGAVNSGSVQTQSTEATAGPIKAESADETGWE